MGGTVIQISDGMVSPPGRCEWGHDDYSMQTENLPKAPPPKGQQELLGEEVAG